jgi:hypothetical protein
LYPQFWFGGITTEGFGGEAFEEMDKEDLGRLCQDPTSKKKQK